MVVVVVTVHGASAARRRRRRVSPHGFRTRTNEQLHLLSRPLQRSAGVGFEWNTRDNPFTEACDLCTASASFSAARHFGLSKALVCSPISSFSTTTAAHINGYHRLPGHPSPDCGPDSQSSGHHSRTRQGLH